MGKQYMHTEFLWGNQLEGDHLEFQLVDESIILRKIQGNKGKAVLPHAMEMLGKGGVTPTCS
jgi:hypothetical protein